MEYLALIYNNQKSDSQDKDWERFLVMARESGMFKGGSEIGINRNMIGEKIQSGFANTIDGYMKFESVTLEELLNLLKSHPVIMHGGSIELLELPKS